MDPSYNRAVSLHLSRTLDEIGLNQCTVTHRRNSFLYREKIINLNRHLKGINSSNFHFGSQTEGSTTKGLNSDTDTLISCNDFNVIEDMSGWKQGKKNLLMLQKGTAPGYCRLQVLGSDVSMVEQDLSDGLCRYYTRDRLLLKNTMLHVLHFPGIQTTRHGPAQTPSRQQVGVDGDVVYAFPCTTWPAQAEEFKRRHRRHGWPSQHLLQQATTHGVFLVPVGHKLSRAEPLEWRISASFAERCLMFSLNILHIKCYVLLKMLVKTFVEPFLQKCISSYHCKTALLYCAENTEPGFWRDDNLLQCVQQCLTTILAWVGNGFCPQFIMPQENLFDGKVSSINKRMLRKILIDLVKSTGRDLLRVSIDDLGNKLQTRLSKKPSTVPVLDSMASVSLVADFEFQIKGIINKNLHDITSGQIGTPLANAAHSVHQKIRMLKDRLRQTDRHDHQVIQAFIEFLSCWLGSLLASVAISRKTRVPKTALQLFSVGTKSDVASVLKLASVFYCSGDVRKTERILHMVEAHFRQNEILQICPCFPKSPTVSQEFCHMMFVLRGSACRRARAKLFACCLIFAIQEIHCAPPALRNELYRADGDDARHRNPALDIWMNTAAVDCQPYLYFLQYLNNRQMGKLELQEQSRQNLERCIKVNHNLNHLETAWNLLGQCMEMEQKLEAAKDCYRSSLAIRPRNNAANWHMRNLRYTAIRSGCL